jgi:hypothetical protein
VTLSRRSLFASALALLVLPKKVAAERLLAAPIPEGWTSAIAADCGYDHGDVEHVYWEHVTGDIVYVGGASGLKLHEGAEIVRSRGGGTVVLLPGYCEDLS